MTHTIVVNLSSNGLYWHADWKDAHGRRRRKSLGPKSSLSHRQALKLCQNLANRLNLNPALVESRTPCLGPYVDSYIASRTDLKPGTLYLHRLTRKYLVAFFGEQKHLDEITRANAREWVSVLARGLLTEARPMAPPTVRGHVVNAKAVFRRAVDDDILLLTPFDRVSVPLPKQDKNWHYVSMTELEKLMGACKTVGWKCLIALCRLAGLRRGEALHVPWSAVDFDKRTLTVFAEKTGQRRVVPIVPRLFQILSEALKARPDGAVRVCDVNPHCLWRNFTVIRKRAGLPAWDDAFQVMRRNCETDWAQQFPQYVVSEWLGHDITVSAEHYLTVPAELYAKAAGVPATVPPSSGSSSTAAS